MVMGAFTILMVVCSIYYALDNSQNLTAVALIGIFIASYAIPLLLNFNHLKVVDFFKGAVYGIYLSPTYANIFTIFAISNIHDVSWGSRPGGNTQDKNAAAKVRSAAAQKDELYKNYRANFLIVWLSVNVAVGGVVTYTSRNGQDTFLLGLGIALSSVISVKLVLSTIHKAVSFVHHLRVLCHIRYLPKREEGSLHQEVRDQQINLVDMEFSKFRLRNTADEEALQDAKDNDAVSSFQQIMKNIRRSTAPENEVNELQRLSRVLIASRKEDVTGKLRSYTKSLNVDSKAKNINFRRVNELEPVMSESEEDSDEVSELSLNGKKNFKKGKKKKKEKKGLLGKIFGGNTKEETKEAFDDKSNSFDEDTLLSSGDIHLQESNRRRDSIDGIRAKKTNKKMALVDDSDEDSSHSEEEESESIE
mmetsp:Transcript_6546/g.5625  ORF Transcript_6546/g.5625 Transcript_6546/m.5625 type:complete len:419 (+) Transcript_6546:344-1600(+)